MLPHVKLLRPKTAARFMSQCNWGGGVATFLLVTVLLLLQFVRIAHEISHVSHPVSGTTSDHPVCATCLALGGVADAQPAGELLLPSSGVPSVSPLGMQSDSPHGPISRPYLSRAPPSPRPD